MARNKGDKDISDRDRESIKCIIRPRLKYRDTHKELLLKLEDSGHNISEPSLGIILREIREELPARFKEIGQYELAQEHDFAIQMMKDLMVKMTNSIKMAEDESERVRISSEIRAIQKDLIDYYGSVDIVENVFKYFNEEEEEEIKEKVEQVKSKVKKKDINKSKKHKLMTEF